MSLKKSSSKKNFRKSSDDEPQVLWKHSFISPLGEIELLANEKGVCQITLPGREANPEVAIGASVHGPIVRAGGVENRKAARQLKEYFSGKRKKFDFKIDLQVDGFYRKALLKGVAKIPYGETRSYGEIAKDVGSPRAARAVGTANATNPLPFVIPCHRVVASSGLGGYGGGLAMKRQLLKIESEFGEK